MSFLQICGIAVLGGVGAFLLNRIQKGSALPLTLGCVTLLFLLLLPKLSSLLTFQALLPVSAFSGAMTTLQKGLGVCLLTEIAGGICRQCGEEEVARVLSMVGKAEILLLALPLVKKLFETVGTLPT